MAWKQSLVLALALAAIAVATPGFPGFGKEGKSLEPGVFEKNGELIRTNRDPKDFSVTIGDIGVPNSLMQTDFVTKEGIFGMSRDKDIIFPKKNELPRYITGIEIRDRLKDGTNGKIRMKDGGVGDDHIKLRFDSQRGHDMDYVVEIYGLPESDSSGSW